jgi:hypothetical protein
MMKLSELHRIVNLYWNDTIPEHRDQEVMISIELPYATVGSGPMVGVKSASAGFDWEHGKFILYPESPLTPPNEELEKRFKKVEKQANEFYMKMCELEDLLKKNKGGK